MCNEMYSSISGLNRDCRGHQQRTSMPYSKSALALCIFLFRRGWISAYSVAGRFGSSRKTIFVEYKFHSNQNAISNICIKSTPGRRLSWSYNKLLSMCKRNKSNSYYVLSTSHGLLSSDEALSRKLGGELLAHILF